MVSPRFCKCDFDYCHNMARVTLEQLIGDKWFVKNYCWSCYRNSIYYEGTPTRKVRFLDR